METLKAERSLIANFLYRNVVVAVERNIEIKGRLLRFQFGDSSKPHKPSLLVVENGSQKLIIRGVWEAIKTERAERVVNG